MGQKNWSYYKKKKRMWLFELPFLNYLNLTVASLNYLPIIICVMSPEHYSYFTIDDRRCIYPCVIMLLPETQKLK